MIGQSPLVSVLVPIYGVEPYIERCAHSLFQQTLEDIEFIFVNDCTKDNSMAVLWRVIDEYPNRKVKVISHSHNQGLAGARNTAFRHASGKYWICCDSDDWVDPNMYEEMVKVAEGEGADIVSCGLIKEDGSSEPCVYEFQEDSVENVLNPSCFGWLYGAVWNKLIRADLFKSHLIAPWVGINMWEDSCLTLRLRLMSTKTIILPQCYYHYNLLNTNSITYAFKRSKVLEMINATERIEEFLLANGFENISRDFINFLKISSKEVLLRFPSEENVKLFKETFPESNRFIWNYSRWNFVLKLRAWLVSFLPLDLAVYLLKLMRRHSLSVS